ncbi:two-component system, response regulator YesN [Halobacillus karajensis]|uniref:Response regulatory protein n=1 Tax=Halobacillus karajensis TaxID=195088 RepID=A0A024P960_9BACI|nr:response regulator [Halobacillus karajensis]CDQ21276.1 putative response regulatory protein [Halobacillus karajensis]CDQ25654.1 putative response regulatory protein [Halobacillus karajensis]CDQ25925.1 putative response regulatory protein [Halobacillus karajensis]SEI10279.1 two-component system, response regulator YesN [Halobacillus karajensis]
MKVLIVDDEINVLEVVRFLGEWDKYGITEILEAGEGEEAKGMIKAEKPEIIFTDIKMPGMSGMELIEWLNYISYQGKVIFITGYNDYDFMRKAIKYNSFDYLLKPIEGEAFNKTLKEAVESWKKDEQKTYPSEDIMDDGYLKLKIDQMVTDACMGEPFNPNDLQPFLPEADHYEVSLLSFYHMHHADPYIKSLAEKLSKQKLGNAFTLQNDRNLCLVLTVEEEWLNVEEWICEHFDIPLRLVTSKHPQPLNHLFDSYLELQEAMDHHQYRSLHRLADFDTARRMKDIVSYVDTYYMEDLSLEKLSNLFFFSREHISRKFKLETGLPLSKYVTKLRIDQAKAWLRETDETIYSISLMLGYQDEKYFSKLFKKVTGYTPFEFRKRGENRSGGCSAYG